MSGIGGRERTGRLVTVQTELPSDIDGISDAVRRIIMLGEIQSITLKNDEPIVYQRFVGAGEEIRPEESTQSYAELTPYEVIRNAPMEDWGVAGNASPHATLIDMFLHMSVLGWVVTHLVLAEGTEFWDWLAVPKTSVVNIKQFLGARIERTKEIPSDAFVLCGAKTRHATVAEIGMSLKGTTHEQRANTENN